MATQNNISIQGKLLNNKQQALPQLRIEAWDKDLLFDDFVGEATSDTKGEFTINFSRDRFQELFLDKRPDLYFKIFFGKEFLYSSENEVLWNIDSAYETVIIYLDLPAATGGTSNRNSEVTGKVLDHKGHAIAHLQVQLYKVTMRVWKVIGGTSTNKEGHYSLHWNLDQPETETADIALKVFDKSDKTQQHALAVSAIVFNAPREVIIDITVPEDRYKPLSEYDQLLQLLMEQPGNISPSQLEEDEEHRDISFLAGRTGWDKNKLFGFALAHRLKDKSKIDAPFWYTVLSRLSLPEIVANNLNEKMERSIDQLSTVSEESIAQWLSAGFSGNKIDQSLNKNKASWLATYHTYMLNYLNTPTEAASLKRLLEIAGLGKKKHEIALDVYLRRGNTGSSWVDGLANNKHFSTAEIGEIKNTFTISDLAMGDIGLVQVLKRKLGERTDVRELAKLSPDDWTEVSEAQSGTLFPFDFPKELGAQTTHIQKSIIAQQISGNFRNTYATTAFVGDLERATRNESEHPLPKNTEILEFLKRKPDFDFLHTKVDDLEAPIDLKEELKGIQRLFKLTSDQKTIALLRADGIHSAQQVYAMGEGQYITKYSAKGVDMEMLKVSFQKAAKTQAAVSLLIGELKATSSSQLLSATWKKGDVTQLFPNWQTLFGAADICDCEHCRSVYSPAAYYADILSFLKHRSTKTKTPVKDELFARRPDLGYVELSCDNANVELPYVDVVCEVLEEAVASSVIFNLSVIPEKGVVSPVVIAQFAAKNIIIAPDAIINEVGSPVIAYTLRDDKQSFKIATDGKISELHQTRRPAEELAAIPQYVNIDAYSKLKTSVYPMSLPADYINKDLKVSLPFDFFSEEVRAYLKKHGVNRWNLMKTFQTTIAPPPLNRPTDVDIAIEYFGISSDQPMAGSDERTLIVAAAPTLDQQKAVWGVPGATSVSDLTTAAGNVNTFLNKTGLEYNDLLKLLDLTFINPSHTIKIVHDDDGSCDTIKKHISNLDLEALDRIHRFLRFWRKLDSWEMWELDLAIQHLPRLPDIEKNKLDEIFLLCLMPFIELKNKLEFSIEETLSLFAPTGINTASKFGEPFHDRKKSFYEELFLNKKKTNPLDSAFELAMIAAPSQTLIGHMATLMAGLKIKEADLDLLLIHESLNKGTNTLTLSNVSLLYRHTMLMRVLQLKGLEYINWLNLSQTKLTTVFETPASALNWWNTTPNVKDLDGISIDELNYVLQADRTSPAAPIEKEVAKFLMQLRTDLSAIAKEYFKNQYDFLTEAEELKEVIRPLLQKTGRTDAEIELVIAVLNNDLHQEIKLPSLSLSSDLPALPVAKITFNDKSKLLSLDGILSDADRAVLLGFNSNTDYVKAINDLHRLPRLWVKYALPFTGTAALKLLPENVDFTSKLKKELSDKISFNADHSVLVFKGIMSEVEKAVLLDLSAEADYQAAINALFNAPNLNTVKAITWLSDNDIPPVQTDNITLFKKAIENLLTYFSQTLSDTLLNQQFASSLVLTPDITERLLMTTLGGQFTIPLANTFSNPTFIASRNAIVSTSSALCFDHYYWLHRVSLLINKLNLNLEELNWLIHYNYKFKPDTKPDERDILDFRTLPIDGSVDTTAYTRFLNLYDLIALQRAHSTKQLSVLEIITKIDTDLGYKEVDFAADMHSLHNEWQPSDVEKLTLSYLKDYAYAATWQQLEKALTLIQKLNGSVDSILPLTTASVTEKESTIVKKLLRVSYSDAQWLEMNKDVQATLRNRKRDSLLAWLLTQPAPANNPSIKWENANDVYAYYLLDVQMGAEQTTSRLVQASGSVQLFVQRCFMGLEPNVAIDTESETADTGWLQWQWMKKYRVWEANRKIFLYPENWFEPQLRKDKSPFFQEMENELLQNEVNKDTVETTFLNYIEKLDNVAQLEIAGFYYEDAKDILHVFGRTALAEPHLYYYRNFDENRGSWSAWVKVDVDIAGDYLVPTMINQRLYLFWPVFTEEPERVDKVNLPSADQGSMDIENPAKRLKVQMAVSEFRNKKWQPKKISTDYISSSTPYTLIIDKTDFNFRPINLLEEEGRFLIQFSSISANINGSFEVFGCKGVPEKSEYPMIQFKELIEPLRSKRLNMKPTEITPDTEDYFALEPVPNISIKDHFTNEIQHSMGINKDAILKKTPDIFKISRPSEPSFIDKILLTNWEFRRSNSLPALQGLFSPFFYADKTRTFFVKPALKSIKNDAVNFSYYPEYKKLIENIRTALQKQVKAYIITLMSGPLTPEKISFEEYLKEIKTNLGITPDALRDAIISFCRMVADLVIFAMGIAIIPSKKYHFNNFYHPFTCLFAKQVANFGIDGLMKREVQLKNSILAEKYYPKALKERFDFKVEYAPTALVVDAGIDNDFKTNDYTYYPMEVVDFTQKGSYSLYNWELFFHAPLMIAERLSQNQRFEEAQQWFHYIFNPLDPTTPTDSNDTITTQKFWITKPFFAMQDEDYNQQRIETIMSQLSDPEKKIKLNEQISYWRNNPFEPNVVAQGRPVAYQKAVVMKYIDNLIAWGDQLFGQDSIESINEATQLYVLAAEILGPRPRKVSPQYKAKPQTFNELESKLDGFSNAMIGLENLIPAFDDTGEDAPSNTQSLSSISSLYFCIPQNEKMLGYWDTVADRLYKIRHCMNIDGVVRHLSLFEPVIDPAALVNAIAGGASLSSALAGLNAPLPFYRFHVMLQKANELCNDVKSLGGALLSALEKKDGEALALLRQSHELKVLDAIRELKEKQIEEAKIVLDGLRKNHEITTIKRDYYHNQEFMNAGENLAMGLNALSTALDTKIAVGYSLAVGLKLIPNFIIGASGFGGSPHATVDTGGEQVGDSAETGVRALSAISHAFDKGASIASTLASYTRRENDWDFQATTASKELENIEVQIKGSELKIKLAEKELKNHDLQVQNAKAVDEYMRSKYTNKELYEWMITQVSQVYFQSYQLAYDFAKRAEKCYQFELGTDKTYLQFGYWDSLKKGLLSGEKLQIDLRRLEAAYMEQNRREFELSKHISLALVNPLALLQLKENGRATIQLPEELFDLDFQGHYFRRIKSLSISIPCIAGPYTTVNATVRLLRNEIRTNASVTDGYAKVDDSDMRFRSNPVGIKAVATSSGQNDSGVFELNFRDERYLPFEGAGVISTWSIELTDDKALRQFDYTTIADIILHLKYTAREDVGTFKQAAAKNLKDLIKDAAENSKMSLVRVFDIKREFATAYHLFKTTNVDPVLKVTLGKEYFPFFAAEAKKISIKTVEIIGRFKGGTPNKITLNIKNNSNLNSFELKKSDSKFGNELICYSQTIDVEVVNNNDIWEFSDFASEQINELSDLYFALTYDLTY